MANFAHYSNVNSLFKKKNEQVWQMRNQDKLASPPQVGFARPKLRRKISLKLIISIVIFGLLLVGGVSAMVLSQLQQDVRQRASGCTYWNGQPATEGAHDNRGGIRQQCVNGYWTVPDDGNTDPSQIIAEQNAAKPKLGCVNWTGESVSHGAYDNRGGIRQQCNNGLWDVPDDGNTDPSGMPKPEREMRGCVNWTGESVSHGAYDVRGDIRQQCVDGLWDAPDDHITDPNDTASLAIVGAIGGLAGGEIEYADARDVYNDYCRGDVHPTDVERCQSFGRLLTNEEQRMRYAALEEKVRSNTDQVSFAIGGLDERTMDYAVASDVYKEYCTGANAQQTSASVCGALRSELDEIAATQAADDLASQVIIEDGAVDETADESVEVTIQIDSPLFIGPVIGGSARPSSVPIFVTRQSGNISDDEDLPIEEESVATRNIFTNIVAAANSYWTNTILPVIRQGVYTNQSNQVVNLYSTTVDNNCTCAGSYEGRGITETVGGSGVGNDDRCYQCYPVSGGGCGFFSTCGYTVVTEVNSQASSDLARLQINNPNNIFLVDELTSSGQVEIVNTTLNLMPESLTSNRNITYLIGNEGDGGGLSGGDLVYVGSPIGEAFTQNPDVENGYGISIVAHETLHSLDDVRTCDEPSCPTYLERFEEVAEESGYVFESEFSDMEVDAANGDFLLYTEYPTTSTEGFAITGAAYMLAPDQLREERPELYEFYRDEVFGGVEYVEIQNSDCVSTRIEVRTTETEQAQTNMSTQCSN